MPDFLTDLFDRIPLGPFDTRLWWLLIGIIAALIMTLQAIETAVEGAWPNQRRTSRMTPRARWVQASWAFVAIFVLAGALLVLGVVAILIWRDPAHPDGLAISSTLVAIGWVLFLLFSLDIFGLGRLMGKLGLIGPIAILIVLVVGDVLLYVALREIMPEFSEIRDSAEQGLRDILPFLN